MKTNFSLKTKTAFFLAALAATSGSFVVLQANPLATTQTVQSQPKFASLEILVQQAISADANKSAEAIKALRQAGPNGMRALVAASRSTLFLASMGSAQKQSAPYKRVVNAFEKVGAQHDNWASKLYWFTDLEAAKAEAKKENKPILSLRLLGNLDEELSCANSRFFRTALYPNADISKMLRENYVLHWQSVRPVPKVTIDFGDGRKIQTTITGNSIHYVLDSQGRVLDALPGLYGPGAFSKWLKRMDKVEGNIKSEDPLREVQLKNFHQQRLVEINRDWQKEASPFVSVFSPFSRLRQTDKTEQPIDMQSIGGILNPAANVQQNVNAQISPALENQDFFAPTARMAANNPMAKMIVERGTLNAITIPIPRDRDALSRKADDDLWQNVAGLHMNDAKLDATSLEVLRTKTSRPQIVAATFEKSVAEDTVRNEYSRHTTIHSWLAENPNMDLQKLNERVYSELFLTPDSDPWLGLLPADAYTGIENDGVSQ